MTELATNRKEPIVSLLDAHIPDVDVAPAGATPSPTAALLRKQQASRRSVLRLLASAGMAVGVSAIAILPGARKAHAGWYSTYSTWTTCSQHGYRTCDANFVSSALCNGAGYHRDDTVRIGCTYERYTVVFTRCWGSDGTSRNAWQWRYGETGGTFPSMRCSDGYYYVEDCGNIWGTESACRYAL